jgi:hypothetical protein
LFSFDYSLTSVSISPNSIPQLCRVTFTCAHSFHWVLTLFADVYQHGQFKSLVLYNLEDSVHHEQLITAKELHQWFLKSTKCTFFQLHLRQFIYDEQPADIIKHFLTEYENLFDARYQLNKYNSFDLFIQYPKEIKSFKIVNNDQNSTETTV